MAATALSIEDQFCVWEAQPGPQSDLIRCPTFEVFFGGARGGGKTDGVLGEWLVHADEYGAAAIGLMVRRSITQLAETIERSRAIYSRLGAQYNEQAKMWRFPNGARLRFAYLERDADAENYMGHSYSRVYVEEIGNFPRPDPILKLMATLRSGAGVPVGFRATGNPGGPGHNWVKSRYIDPAPGGWKIITDPATKLERIYIPSRVADNQYLGADYTQRLRASGSATLVRAWLEGDWDAIEGAFFDCWSQQMVIAPFTIPADWIRFRSGDWGSFSPFSFGWWAVVQDDYEIECATVKAGQTTASNGAKDRAGLGRIFTLPRGALVRYREWYGSSDPGRAVGLKLTAEQVADGIIDRERKEKLAYGVIDPSTFKVDGGPSIGERINRKLVDAKLASFRAADNTRVSMRDGKDKRGPMNGWDQMRARMIGIDGVPMIYCFNTCVASIRTIPVLQHDPVRAEDLDTESEDHCFAAGTLVETDRGAMPIECLPVYGRVLTIGGEFKPYRSARMTRRNAEVVQLQFEDGRKIICTKDHKFLVDFDEWCYASDLAGRSVVCSQKSLVRQFKSLTTSAITCAANIFREKANGCISQCGNFITALFPQDIMSTTRIMIAPIMRLAILNALPAMNTNQVGMGRKAESEVNGIFTGRMLQLLPGMGHQKAGNGTQSISQSTLNRRWIDALKLFASSVAENIWFQRLVSNRVSFVARTAKRVRCVSVEDSPRADVYCLTVPSTGCFALTGGMIVSNCADDWRYACSSRPWTRFVKEPDKPVDAYQAPRDNVMNDVQSSVKLM